MEDIRAGLRHHLKTNVLYKPKKVVSDLERDLQPGWLSDGLIRLDGVMWGRWPLWVLAIARMQPPEERIPQIDFLDSADKTTLGMLERCVERIQEKGRSYWGALEFLMDWLLWSIAGEEMSLENETDHRLSMDLYQMFCLDLMVLYPFDYWGYLLAKVSHGKHNGFYPTPMTVTKAMCHLTFADIGYEPHKTVCDPCVGTGRMLLAASNHSFRLHGQDVDYLVLKACKINLWLYAPWGALPLPEGVWEDAGVEEEQVELTVPDDHEDFSITGLFGE